MPAILIGILAGALVGVIYVAAGKPQVQRTLVSSILLGVFVGVLVELARKPLLTSVFAGVATIFVAEFVRWILNSFKHKS